MQKQHTIFIILFLFYLFVLLVVSFVGLGFGMNHLRTINYEEVNNNFVPLKTLIGYVFNIDHYNFDTWFYNTFGIVILFMPLGFLLPKVFSNLNTLKNVLFFALVLSLCIEVFQFLTKLGVLDVDDVILNLIGAALGYLIFKIQIKSKI
ncbi:VanZ family protein [Bacillus sp. NTK074B]|uniref:VanZ family protein n=1 Tax=Bacillus sp. NTK074B TaxID=2802174 RepID=UPI001A8D150F|nr:VanZ family protein [Bacillus sp. NTK074B]